MRGNHLILAGLLATSAVTGVDFAAAQETTTYTYDALGRLARVARSGGPASGANSAYSYDAAGNRTNVKVTDAPVQPPGTGVSGQKVFIVVPLNGYTLIESRRVTQREARSICRSDPCPYDEVNLPP